MSQLAVNPLFKPPPGGGRSYLFQAHMRGALYRDGGLFNLELMMVSVVHKELEKKVDKLKNKKF